MMIPTDIEAIAYDEDKKCYIDVQLFKIRATKDFGDVKAGDFGGFVQNESNLSQEGDCWVYDEAKVYDGAVVKGNAKICNKTRVKEKSKVNGEVIIKNSSITESVVIGNSIISDVVMENSTIVNSNISKSIIVDSDIYDSILRYQRFRYVNLHQEELTEE